MKPGKLGYVATLARGGTSYRFVWDDIGDRVAIVGYCEDYQNTTSHRKIPARLRWVELKTEGFLQYRGVLEIGPNDAWYSNELAYLKQWKELREKEAKP